MAAAIHTIRVRYAESDQMGVAHHAAYIAWLEECRIELLRQVGASYRELEARGVLMPVVELTIRYRRSLRFDDVATFATTVDARSPSRVVFATTISHGDQVCAEAQVTVAATGRDGRPMRVPAEVAVLLNGVGSVPAEAAADPDRG
jgi:acyl-CoA thioester hydrolase